VALVSARLGPLYPRTGGPYVFAREAFGDFAGFLVVWSYWISSTVGNAAIALGVVGYVPGFSLLGKFLVAQAMVCCLTILNVLGIRNGARFQIGVMVLNIVPLLVFSALAIGHFDASNLVP